MYHLHSLSCLNKAVNRITGKVSSVCIKLRLELSSVSYRVCRSLALVLQSWISALGMLSNSVSMDCSGQGAVGKLWTIPDVGRRFDK